MKNLVKQTLTGIFVALLSGVIFAHDSKSKKFDSSPPRNQTVSKSIYSIKIKGDNKLSASIRARIPLKDKFLQMFPYGANWKYKEGWAKFVKNLRVSDINGKGFEIKPLENAKWEIIGDYPEEVVLDYQVDFGFALKKWEPGNEQAAHFEDDTLFTVTKALFIASQAVEETEVSFELPEKWKVATSWNPVGGKPNVFRVGTLIELVNNCVVLGQFGSYSYRQDNFAFTLVQLGSLKKAETLMAEVMKKQLNAYRELFGGLPETNYLQVIFKGPEDGEAYANSSAFTTDLEPARHNIILWGNTLSHELLHKWNGSNTLIAAQDRPTSQWFSEGFTEYYSNKMLLRTDLINENTFLKKMEKHLGMYLFYNWSGAFKDSIKDSGKRKGFNRPGVYSGGWAVAFCLDIMIRDKTENTKNLDDFMRQMYKEFGLTGKKVFV